MNRIESKSLMDGTRWFPRFNWSPEGSLKLDPLLEAPDPATTHAASVALFNEPERTVKEIKANPQDSHYVYASDTRYLDPEFRMQEATRILSEGEDALEDPTPHTKKIHSYWINYYCQNEINYLVARTNQAYFQTNEQARQERIQKVRQSFAYKVVQVLDSPAVNIVMSGVGAVAAVCMYSYFFSRPQL